MESLANSIKGMTSKKSETSIFKVFAEREVLETKECKCGTTFESKYLFTPPGRDEPILSESDMCYTCGKEEQDKKAVEKMLADMERRKKEKYLNIFKDNSLINPKLLDSTFENYEATSGELAKGKEIAVRYADKFSLDNPVGLMFMGNYGTGKSHLSVSITKKLIEKEFTRIFISTPKLMTKIRSTYSKDSEYTEDQIIEVLSNVDCLVLDDIGAESTKQGDNNQHTWATSKLFEIIDNRIGKHTIFTTNYNFGELESRLGGRNFSRMMENIHLVKMYGDDYRLRKFK